jgi:hypothetical protein
MVISFVFGLVVCGVGTSLSPDEGFQYGFRLWFQGPKTDKEMM